MIDNKPELLAPAGNLEKLKWAIAYGADAVYFGMKDFSLRAFADNFSLEDAKEAFKILHSEGKKGYVTLNIYPYTEEYDDIISLAKKLEKIGADAFIVADLGLIIELKNNNISTPIHVSTQANTLSYQTMSAYQKLGCSRANLARELSIDKISNIQKSLKKNNKTIETEVFIHGSVCFSYSGRCAISDYMQDDLTRSANRGGCTHPCRWKYSVVEEKREGEYYPVYEDKRGLYLFNSKDLALFSFVKDLKKYGVKSFKIEGRMKTLHYIATVVSFYRRILDGEEISNEKGLKYLSTVNNRGYSQGFMKGDISADDYDFELNAQKTEHLAKFVANTVSVEELQIVLSKRKINPNELKISDIKGTVLRTRNRIFAGEKLEVLQTNKEITEITMNNPIILINGEQLDVVHNDNYIIMPDIELPEYTILRKRI